MRPRSNDISAPASRRLAFGAPSRGAAEIGQLCRRAILAYLLPAALGLTVAYTAIQLWKGLPVSPAAAFLFVVTGLSFVARRAGRYGTGAATFLIGTYVCLFAYSLGVAGDPNGLATGAAYTLCFYPMFVWVCSDQRWQRLAGVGVAMASLVAVYAAGQGPDASFYFPDALLALALARSLFLVVVSLGIVYGFDISIERSHRRLEAALARQVELNGTLDRQASDLKAAHEAREESVRELRESQSRYHHLFHNAFDGIVLFDGVEDRAVEVNTTLAKRLGYPADELLELHPAEVSPEFQADGRPTAEARAEVTAAILANDSCRYPWRHLTREGEPVDFEIHTFCVGGEGRYRVSMLRDVTEQLRAEAGMQEANRELRSFAHAASHDLKEPLRTMSNFARLLERRYADRLDESGLQYLGFITDAARRGTRLVTDLLRYAEAGTDEVALERVSLAQTGLRVRDAVEARLSEEGASLEIGELPDVMATETWAQQLLQNLVSNALKFQRPGVPPVVRVTARETAQGHEIAVTDNGIGIAEENLGRVFGVFERLVLRDQYEGSGIGLALCRRIMDRVNGRIRVESVLGEGTTFTLCFPKVPEAVAEEAVLA